MKKIVAFLVMMMGIGMNAQSINDVEYIKLKKTYDFQTEQNEYRLNSNMKFRFEEMGYKVYFEGEEVPQAVKNNPCKELICNLTTERNALATVLNVELVNCKGVSVAKGKGDSRLKLHKKSYLDALDQAFKYSTIGNLKKK